MKQIWLRHKNGGGKVFGNDASVSDDSYLDRQSSVGDSAEIYNARLIESHVCGNSVVSTASVWDSSIQESVRVVGSGKGVVIAESELLGEARISQSPTIVDVTLRDVWVFGDAVLEGPWVLAEAVRIHRGAWAHPPRYAVIEDGTIRVVLSECMPGHGHLGCWCLPYKEWFRPGYRQRLGAHSGWTPRQIEFAFDTFSMWAN